MWFVGDKEAEALEELLASAGIPDRSIDRVMNFIFVQIPGIRFFEQHREPSNRWDTSYGELLDFARDAAYGALLRKTMNEEDEGPQGPTKWGSAFFGALEALRNYMTYNGLYGIGREVSKAVEKAVKNAVGNKIDIAASRISATEDPKELAREITKDIVSNAQLVAECLMVAESPGLDICGYGTLRNYARKCLEVWDRGLYLFGTRGKTSYVYALDPPAIRRR